MQGTRKPEIFCLQQSKLNDKNTKDSAKPIPSYLNDLTGSDPPGLQETFIARKFFSYFVNPKS